MKTHRVVFTAAAEGDLDGIYEHIAMSSGEDRARSVIDRLVQSCLALDLFPPRGTSRDDLMSGLRVFAHRDWATIAFTIEGSIVTIEGVSWRRRNVAAVLGRDR